MALPVTIALAGIIPIILNHRQLPYGVLLILSYLAVIYYFARIAPESIPQHNLDRVHLNDRFINIAIISLGFSLLTNIVMTTYRDQRDKLKTLNRTLEDKNKVLVKTINKVELLASRLEKSRKEQQEIAQELQTNNVFLDTLFESIPIPVFYKNRSLDFKRVNSEFCEVLGLEKEDIVGKKVDEIRPDVDLLLSVQTDKKVLESRHIQSYETTMKYHDGLNHHVIVSKSRHTDSKGNILGLVGSITDITERRIREEQIRYLAHHDMLTDLHNRAFFNAEIDKKMARAKRKTEKFAILLIDLDGFKKINDTLGHDAGDATLKAVGKRLKSSIRKYDTVCRFGGDEFAIILDDVSRLEEVVSVAEKILRTLAEEIIYHGNRCVISGSIGIALFPDVASRKDHLLKAADEAMYKAKSQGKNQYTISDPYRQDSL